MRRALAGWCFALAGFAVAVPAVPAAAGGGCHRLTAGTGTAVAAAENCFGPGVLRVEPGAEVTWVNRDQIAHAVIGTGWGLADLAPGATGTYRFAAEGTYPYSCHLHPGMNGVVIVGSGVGATGSEPVRLDVTPASGAGTATPASSGGDGSAGTLGAGAAGAAGGAVAGLAGGRMWRRSRRGA